MAAHSFDIQSEETGFFFIPQGQSGQLPAAQLPPQVNELIWITKKSRRKIFGIMLLYWEYIYLYSISKTITLILFSDFLLNLS